MPDIEPLIGGLGGLGVLFTFTTILVKRTRDMDARNDAIALVVVEERDKATKSRDEIQAKYDNLLMDLIKREYPDGRE
jgi:hypothetical protein